MRRKRLAESGIFRAQLDMAGQVEEIALCEAVAVHGRGRQAVARIMDQDPRRLGREFGKVHQGRIARLA